MDNNCINKKVSRFIFSTRLCPFIFTLFLLKPHSPPHSFPQASHFHHPCQTLSLNISLQTLSSPSPWHIKPLGPHCHNQSRPFHQCLFIYFKIWDRNGVTQFRIHSAFLVTENAHCGCTSGMQGANLESLALGCCCKKLHASYAIAVSKYNWKLVKLLLQVQEVKCSGFLSINPAL